jgi:hypothetical protein
MFYGNFDYTTLLKFGMYLFFIISAIHALKDKHAREIYVIWYINSFFFIFFFGMGVVAEKKNIRLLEVCGSYEETCETIYDYLTNSDDEIALVLIFTAPAIGPQLLTYVLSGLSGSASAPKFVGASRAASSLELRQVRGRFWRHYNSRAFCKVSCRKTGLFQQFCLWVCHNGCRFWICGVVRADHREVAEIFARTLWGH